MVWSIAKAMDVSVRQLESTSAQLRPRCQDIDSAEGALRKHAARGHNFFFARVEALCVQVVQKKQMKRKLP